MASLTQPRDPKLLKLKFQLPKDRDSGKPYGTTEYSANAGFVYKRCPHPEKRYEYFRVAVGKVFHLTYWYDIDPTWWELVDVYGIPVKVTGS